MGATFVLLLREGLEASLIVGILLAYLAGIGRRDQARNIWWGVLIALAVSAVVGALLFLVGAELEGRAEEIYEGVASLVAVGFLTWMIFWMRRHAVNLKQSLHDKVAEALKAPSHTGLAAVAFIVVAREGIETALFLFAALRQVGVGPGSLGALLGLAVAVALGAGTYQGGVRLNLRRFFTLTGAFLLVIAAGLAAHGTHELIEAGLVPAGISSVWDLNGVLDDRHGLGAVLKQLFGYNADPALTELGVWLSYLGVTGFLFFRPILQVRRRPAAASA